MTTSVTAVVVGGNATPAAPQMSTTAPANTGQKGAVYHITADGLWDRLWQSSLDTPFDAAFDERGALVVGTGPNGKLYRVSRNPPRTVLSGQAPARQVTRLLPEPDGSIAYATANPGKIMRMASSLAARGTYESEVHDAAAAARWGTIRWARRDAGREPHRAGHAIGEHRDSQRHLERMVGRPYRCVGRPDHQPQRALSAVAGHPPTAATRRRC